LSAPLPLASLAPSAPDPFLLPLGPLLVTTFLVVEVDVDVDDVEDVDVEVLLDLGLESSLDSSSVFSFISGFASTFFLALAAYVSLSDAPVSN
jgi:hypothetical protein